MLIKGLQKSDKTVLIQLSGYCGDVIESYRLNILTLMLI